MISYKPLQKTLIDLDLTIYDLEKYHIISHPTAQKIRDNKPLNQEILNRICYFINKPIDCVLEYIPIKNEYSFETLKDIRSNK